MRVKTYSEAVQLARCAGEDAANRRARKAGRKAWSAADHDHAAHVTQSILVDLGFDIVGWLAVAGLKRNEPDGPKPAKKSKRRSKAAPVQLNFAFA
ncbi:MAG: hypothetical protein K2X41_03290 [Hyphomicrobium sp.]|nr:hypothetical protein [Hyphomicrobium sp.]